MNGVRISKIAQTYVADSRSKRNMKRITSSTDEYETDEKPPIPRGNTACDRAKKGVLNPVYQKVCDAIPEASFKADYINLYSGGRVRLQVDSYTDSDWYA